VASWTVPGVRGAHAPDDIVEQFSQTSHPKPFDKAVQALFDLGFWVVLERIARLGNVGVSLWNIAWLWRLTVDNRGHVELFLEK
jgi:hypothetical protein